MYSMGSYKSKMTDEEIKEKVREHIDYISKRVELVASKNYTQLFPYFVRVLKRTRIPFLKRNGFWVGVLQLGMLRNLPKFQGEVRLIRDKFKDSSITEKEKKNLRHRLMIYQEWIRIYQTIADGIAWRVLNFNRPVLRLLSENDSPGHIHPPYAEILKKFVSSSDTVLINDLTRYLRIGDLTRVTKDGRVLLYELKKDGGVIVGMSDIFRETKKHGATSLSRQRHRHWTAQMSMVNQSINIPIISGDRVRDEHRADIIVADFPISHNFDAIKSLIKKANKSGLEQAELEEGYFVEVTAFDAILSKTKGTDDIKSYPLLTRKKQSVFERPEWCRDKKTKIMDLSSFESFMREGNQFPRNFTPQSVLPFSSKDCVRLMMGLLEIRTILNLDFLKKKLEELGWSVREIEPLSKPPKKDRGLTGEFMPELPNEDFLDLSKSDENGKYHTVIPLTLILIALSSYYKIDFILKAVNDGFERGRKEKPKGRNMTINFTGESKVLV